MARFTSDGEFVPLDRQDTGFWSRLMIEEAEDHLRSAASLKRIGRYQLEAAIQSIHADRAVTGKMDLPYLKKSSPAELPTTNPIGLRADICCNY